MLVSTVLAWDADRLAHGLRGFWDAPWLFPYRHSLAYSEHLIGDRALHGAHPVDLRQPVSHL